VARRRDRARGAYRSYRGQAAQKSGVNAARAEWLRLLQVAPNSIEHLELERVAGNPFADGKFFDLIDNLFVMGCQTVINATLQENFRQADIVRVYFRFLLEGNIGRFFIGAFA